MNIAAIEERLADFVAKQGKLPALSTMRMWGQYKVPRRVLKELLSEQARKMTALPLKEQAEPRLDGMVALPTPRAPIASQWPEIPLPALVFSDIHIPAQDNEWLTYIVKKAIQHGIRRAIIVGDIFDFVHFSKFPNTVRWTAEEEFEDGRQLMAWLAQFMTEVHLIPGNHDDRFANRLDREMSSVWILKQAAIHHPGIFHVHRHHHAYVGKTWLVSHPRSYSRVPTQPALDLAKAYNRNVAVGHTHHFNVGRYFGRWAVEIGMVADANRLDYKHVELTTHPSAELGALLIMGDERPLLLHPSLAL